MADARLGTRGGDHDWFANGARSGDQCRESGRVDAVIVGEEKFHGNSRYTVSVGRAILAAPPSPFSLKGQSKIANRGRPKWRALHLDKGLEPGERLVPLLRDALEVVAHFLQRLRLDLEEAFAAGGLAPHEPCTF